MSPVIEAKINFLTAVGPNIDLVGYLRWARYSIPEGEYLLFRNSLINSNTWDMSYVIHDLLPWETIHTIDTTIDPIRRQKLLAYKGPGSLHCHNQILRDYSLRNDMSFDYVPSEPTTTHIPYSDLTNPLFWTKSFLLRTMIRNFLAKGDPEIVVAGWSPFTRPNGKKDVLIHFMHRDILRSKYRDAGYWYKFTYSEWKGGYNWTRYYFTYVQLIRPKSPFGNQLDPSRWTHHWSFRKGKIYYDRYR